jgi:hypothetical protein
VQPGKASVTALFSAPAQYLIPVFQRGYVWTLEKQVAPLWADLEDRALKLTERNEQAQQVGSHPLKALQKHFLGSLVLTPVTSAFGRVTAYEVIDGQQRTTTLHLLLLAFRHAAGRMAGAPVSQMLDALVRNTGPFSVTSDHHKVWPTQAGRAEMAFLDEAENCQAVILRFPAKQGRQRLDRPLLVQSYLYLYHACLAYLRGLELSDSVSPETEQTRSDALIHAIRHTNQIGELGAELDLDLKRAETLYMTLQELVQIMTLTLEPEDDPQVIFETLNARGEPLLASDLIRNFVFLEAARRDLPVGDLYERHWEEFDEQRDKNDVVTANRYWRAKERQGRIIYPRIDLFFYHYTVLRRLAETKVSHVFQGFKEWWQSEDRNLDTELQRVVRTSQYFRDFISPEGGGYLAEFARLIKALDVGTITPVYLALRERLEETSDELRQALGDLSSFLTRRAVCGFTTKSYNRLFLRLLAEVQGSVNPASALRAHLLKLGGHSQEWPSDEQFQTAWRNRPVYDVLRPGKVGAVLRALEVAARTRRQETLRVDEPVTVEHVLPQSWEKTTFYPLAGADLATKMARSTAIQTFGNLTLLTQPLNSSVSNGPFADYECNGVVVAGKRTKFRESVLLINTYFQDPRISAWSDEQIADRSEHLWKQAIRVWARPVPIIAPQQT